LSNYYNYYQPAKYYYGWLLDGGRLVAGGCCWLSDYLII
jgi:hypothetical protein